jgi:hypothetical protein
MQGVGGDDAVDVNLTLAEAEKLAGLLIRAVDRAKP